MRSGRPAARRSSATAGIEQQDEGRVGREAAGRGRVQLAHGRDPETARGALVGERRVDVAVAHDPRAAQRAPAGSRARRARRARPRTAPPPPRPSSRARRAAARGSARRAACRRARAPRRPRGPRPRAHSASSAACVVLPEPSMPSNVTNMRAPTIRAHAGGRHRWSRVHRIEPRRPARRARRRGASPSTTSPPASART